MNKLFLTMTSTAWILSASGGIAQNTVQSVEAKTQQSEIQNAGQNAQKNLEQDAKNTAGRNAQKPSVQSAQKVKNSVQQGNNPASQGMQKVPQGMIAKNPDGSIQINLKDYVILMMSKQKFDELESVLSSIRTSMPKGKISTEILFFSGLTAMQSKRFGDAEQFFRQILDKEPQNLRVRFELAQALFMQEKDIAADYNFKKAFADAENIQQKLIILSYQRAIAARKNISFDFSMGLYPNENVNNAPAVKEYDLYFGENIWTVKSDEDPKFALGLLYNTGVSYTYKTKGNSQYTTGISLNGTAYEEKKYSNLTSKLYVSRYSSDISGFNSQNISTSYYQDFDKEKPYKMPAVTVSASWGHFIKKDMLLMHSYSHTRTRYDLKSNERSTDVMNAYNFTPTYRQFLNGAAQYWQVSVPFSRNLNNDDNDLEGKSVGLSLQYTQEFGNRITLTPYISSTFYKSDDVIQYHAGANGSKDYRKKRTRSIGLTTKMGNLEFFGFVPQLNMSYTDIDSSILIDRKKYGYASLDFTQEF